MKIRPLLLLLLLGLAVHPARADDEQAIRAAAQTWIERYSAGDLDGLMQLYTEDATVALHGKPVLKGKTAIRNFFAAGIGKSAIDFQIDIEVIEIHGDVAHFMSKYYLTAVSKQDGSVYRDAGRSLLIYKKDRAGQYKGQWKLHLDIDQATPDAVFDDL
ncbi:MAG: YybH family protein [Gammaproteobacteria bacterium]